MRKSLLMCIFTLAVIMQALAQWSSDPTKNLRLSKTDDSGSGFIKVLDNGKYYVAWLYSSNKGFGMKVTLLNADGTLATGWPEGGLVVDDNYASSYETSFGMAVTKDNCVVLAHSDSRNDPDKKEAFETYIYCIGEDGKFVWDKNGIPLLDGPATPGVLYQRPRVTVNNDGTIWVGCSLAGSSGECMFNLFAPKDGKKLLSKNVVIAGTFDPHAVPSGESDFIICCRNSATNVLTAHKFDKNGQSKWLEPVRVSQTYTSSNNNEISGMESDGEGGTIIAFQGNSGVVHYPVVQRISADGDILMGLDGVTLSSERGIMSIPRIDVDLKNKVIYGQWVNSTDNLKQHFWAQKIDFNGERQWDSKGVRVTPSTESTSYKNGGIAFAGDGAIGVYAKQAGSNLGIIRAYYISDQGEVKWNDVILSGAISSGPRDVTKFKNNQVVGIWNGYYAQNVTKDGKIGKGSSIRKNTFDENCKAYYSKATNQVVVDVNMPANQQLVIEVYDMLGHRVTTLYNNKAEQGQNSYSWTPASANHGVYIVSVIMGNEKQTMKIIL